MRLARIIHSWESTTACTDYTRYCSKEVMCIYGIGCMCVVCTQFWPIVYTHAFIQVRAQCFCACAPSLRSRVDQNYTYAPYMTVYLLISLPELPYVLCTPYTYVICGFGQPYIITIYIYILYDWWYPCQEYRMCTVYIWGSGQPYVRTVHLHRIWS